VRRLIRLQLVERNRFSVRLAHKALGVFRPLQLFGGHALGRLVELGHVNGCLVASRNFELLRSFLDGFLEDAVDETGVLRRLGCGLAVAFRRGWVGALWRCGLFGRCGLGTVFHLGCFLRGCFLRGCFLRGWGLCSGRVFRGVRGIGSVLRFVFRCDLLLFCHIRLVEFCGAQPWTGRPATRAICTCSALAAQQGGRKTMSVMEVSTQKTASRGLGIRRRGARRPAERACRGLRCIVRPRATFPTWSAL